MFFKKFAKVINKLFFIIENVVILKVNLVPYIVATLKHKWLYHVGSTSNYAQSKQLKHEQRMKSTQSFL